MSKVENSNKTNPINDSKNSNGNFSEFEPYQSYNHDIEKVVNRFNVKSNKGLDSDEAIVREKKYGKNSFIKEDKFRLIKIFFSNFNNVLMYILFGAGIISLFAKEVIEFYIILGIIIVTILLSFFQQFSADRTVKALNKLRPKNVMVLRDGKKITIDPIDLVIGDIVYLRRGDVVPADMRVIECEGLSVDESILTGESISKSKSSNIIEKADVPVSDRSNIVFASTSVNSGSGIGLVYATGFDTEIGKLSKTIQEAKKEKSPLQKKVDVMSKQISYIIIGLCILLFVLLLVNNVSITMSLLIVGAVAVAGIPESFPLALTLSLSKGVRDMAKNNALLKNLNSVETLGNTTVICTDKTGTLTQNKMKISKIHFASDEVYDIKGKAYEPEYEFFNANNEKVEAKNFDKKYGDFFISSVLCNNSSLIKEDEGWKLDGESTEGAFISLSQSLGYDEFKIRDDYEKKYEVPFTPEKKYMITLHKKNKQKKYVVSMKGAAERVIDKCSHYKNAKGQNVAVNEKVKKSFLEKIDIYTSMGYRVMAVATKHITNESEDKIKNNIENKSYNLEGIVAIEDPIRDEVYDAVKTCNIAGIKTVMITGDHKFTAMAIAKKLEIISSDKDLVITGEELSEMDDKHLDSIIKNIKVFSRVTPEDKYRIISSFQRTGEIVAMTGDGVNDAPALKKADIGVSMGKNGTEVAREASDMILLDDNFSTIVNAVREGRTIYSNIRRFVYYLLTTNFAQVGIILLAVILGFSYMLPLSAIMILFINIVTSTFPALALSIEPTHNNIMTYKPRSPKEKILSTYIMTKIMVIFPIMMFGALLLFLWMLKIFNSSLDKAMTVAFLVMVFSGLFHTFNAKKLHTTVFQKDFFSNKALFISVGFSTFLTILAIGTDVGREMFGLVPISVHDWIIVMIFSIAIIAFAEMLKLSISVEFQEQSALKGLKNYLE